MNINKTGNEPVKNFKSHKKSHGSEGVKDEYIPSQTGGENTPSSIDKDYYFTPPYKVYYNSSSRQWIMELPNAKIPCPMKPAWLDQIDKSNQILDQSNNPRELKKLTDEIASIATDSYDATQIQFDGTKLTELLVGITDSKMLEDTKKIFDLRLQDETQSTHTIGGAMAGSRCSEMHKYSNILKALGERIAELGRS
jgi:hypothetical protein